MLACILTARPTSTTLLSATRTIPLSHSTQQLLPHAHRTIPVLSNPNTNPNAHPRRRNSNASRRRCKWSARSPSRRSRRSTTPRSPQRPPTPSRRSTTRSKCRGRHAKPHEPLLAPLPRPDLRLLPHGREHGLAASRCAGSDWFRLLACEVGAFWPGGRVEEVVGGDC